MTKSFEQKKNSEEKEELGDCPSLANLAATEKRQASTDKGFHIVRISLKLNSKAPRKPLEKGDLLQQQFKKRKTEVISVLNKNGSQIESIAQTGRKFHVCSEDISPVLESCPETALDNCLEDLLKSNQPREYLIAGGHRPSIRQNLGLPQVGLSCGDTLLRTTEHAPGIHSEYLYCSAGLSAAALHREDADTHSANYLYIGCPKLWLFINPASTIDLESRLANHLRLKSKVACSQFVRHQSILTPPALLRKLGIHYTVARQHPGDLIMVLTGTYHMVVNEGPNIAGAINYAPEQWSLHPLYQFCSDNCPGTFLSRNQFVLTHKRQSLEVNSRWEDAEYLAQSAASDTSEWDDTEPAKTVKSRSFNKTQPLSVITSLHARKASSLAIEPPSITSDTSYSPSMYPNKTKSLVYLGEPSTPVTIFSDAPPSITPTTPNSICSLKRPRNEEAEQDEFEDDNSVMEKTKTVKNLDKTTTRRKLGIETGVDKGWESGKSFSKALSSGFEPVEISDINAETELPWNHTGYTAIKELLSTRPPSLQEPLSYIQWWIDFVKRSPHIPITSGHGFFMSAAGDKDSAVELLERILPPRAEEGITRSWLSDTIILSALQTYFQDYTKKDVLVIDPLVSRAAYAAKDFQLVLHGKRSAGSLPNRIVMPCHWEGHWNLLIADAEVGKNGALIQWSMNGDNHPVLEFLVQGFQNLRYSAPVQVSLYPNAADVWNCGVWVVAQAVAFQKSVHRDGNHNPCVITVAYADSPLHSRADLIQTLLSPYRERLLMAYSLTNLYKEIVPGEQNLRLDTETCGSNIGSSQLTALAKLQCSSVISDGYDQIDTKRPRSVCLQLQSRPGESDWLAFYQNNKKHSVLSSDYVYQILAAVSTLGCPAHMQDLASILRTPLPMPCAPGPNPYAIALRLYNFLDGKSQQMDLRLRLLACKLTSHWIKKRKQHSFCLKERRKLKRKEKYRAKSKGKVINTGREVASGCNEEAVGNNEPANPEQWATREIIRECLGLEQHQAIPEVEGKAVEIGFSKAKTKGTQFAKLSNCIFETHESAAGTALLIPLRLMASPLDPGVKISFQTFLNYMRNPDATGLLQKAVAELRPKLKVQMLAKAEAYQSIFLGNDITPVKTTCVNGDEYNNPEGSEVNPSVYSGFFLLEDGFFEDLD